MTDTTPMQPQGPRPVDDLIAEMRAFDVAGGNAPSFGRAQRDLPAPRPIDEIVSSTVESAQPFDWDAYGWGSLSDKERRYLEEFAGTQAGARVDATNIPVFGSGVQIAQDLEAARDSLAVTMGEASPDQAFRDAYRFFDAQRKQSSKAKIGQVMADSATIMAELAGAAFTGGAAGASIGARIGWGAGRKATSMTLLARAAAMRGSQAGRAAGTLGTAVLGREYLPQIIGSPGGQSTVNALNRALPSVMEGLTEEQRLAFAEYTDRQFAEEILPMVLDEHPIWKGMAEDALSTSVEMGGGAVLSKLPPFAVVKGLQMRLLQRAAKGGGGPARIAKVLEDKAFVSDFFSEVGEEIMQGAAVEGAFGKGDLAKRLMSGIPTEWEQYAAIFAMSDMPPAAAAAYQSARSLARRVDEQENGIRIDNPTSADMGREVMVGGKLPGVIVGVRNDPDGIEGGTRVEVQFQDGTTEMVSPSVIRGIPVGAPGAMGDAGAAETSTGGDAISAGEATAGTAGVEPAASIDPEAVASFAAEAGIAEPQVVQPRTETEAAAVQLARNLGREIILVSGQGSGRVTGMIDEQGRMFVHADSADPLGVAVHEMGHDLADKLGPEEFRRELGEIEKVAPGFVSRYRDAWLRRNEAARAAGQPVSDEQRRLATAGHISPHRFDKFDHAYMGTGEGAQAFGWGSYFWTDEEVRDYYRRTMSQGGRINGLSSHLALLKAREAVFEDTSEAGRAAVEAAMNGDDGAILRYAQGLQERGAHWIAVIAEQTYGQLGGPEPWQLKGLVEDLSEQLKREGRGSNVPSVEQVKAAHAKLEVEDDVNEYQVDLTPQEDEYLLWDAPLSEQSEKVREALGYTDGALAEAERELAEAQRAYDSLPFASMGITAIQASPEAERVRAAQQRIDALNGTGESHYRFRERLTGSPQAASQALLASGIRGIKYLDGNSRGRGEGSYNYVVFDESDITIETINGEPIAPAPPTESNAFKRWFGDSKANTSNPRIYGENATPNAQPATVFHGRSLDRDQDADLPLTEVREGGLWMTDNPHAADEYAGTRYWKGKANPPGDRPSDSSKYGQILPLHVKIERPLYVELDGGHVNDRRAFAMRKFRKEPGKYDGIIFLDGEDTIGGINAQPRWGTVYWVPDSTQIKSATGNRGTFDPSNPDIRYAGDAAPSQGVPSPDLATEEGFTSLAEEYAALISYASTTQGAQDMRAVASYTPTLFQRMVDTVRRFVRRVKPDSPMGALDRIQKATRQRPDKAAAALSVYLADLYKRGFGVDTRAAEGAAPAADVPQGASLLQMLQEEGRRLGVEPVNPAPAADIPPQPPSSPTNAPGSPVVPQGVAAAPEAPGAPQAPANPNETQTAPQSATELQAAPGGAGVPPTAAMPAETAQGIQQAQEAVQGALAGGAPGIFETPPRSDLNQPSPSAAQRSLADVVDYVRGNPGQGPRAARKAEGLERLRQDYDGVRSNIETLLTNGQILNAWQTHALNQIIAGLELDALRGDKAAAEDAVRLSWLRRDNRSDLSAAMSANVGEGRAAGDSDFELMVEFINKMPSRDAQRYAELRAQYAATASALGLSPGFRGDARQTNFRNRNAANGDQFQSGKRFASPLNSEGQLRSAEELADIARKMKAIEARNNERMRKAGQAVANLGLGKTLDQLVPDDFIHPDYGYKIVNAITTAKATWYDKFIEYWYISVLGGPKTQLVNISGNAVMGGKQGTIDKISEGMVNLILPEVWGTKRKDATMLQEAAWWWQGFMPGLTKGYRNYLRALRTEMPVYEPELRRKGVENLGDYAMKVEDLYGPQIGGKLGKTLRFPSTTQLLAWDEFMKTTIAQSQTWSAAMRKAASEGLTGDARKRRAHALLQDYTDDIYTEGVYAARRATFQDKGGVISEKIIELGRKAHDTLEVVGNKWAFGLPLYLAVLPFKRTPVRIAGAFARLTPLQLFSVGVEAWAGRNDPDAGYRGNRMKLVRDLSDSLQAIGLTALVVSLFDMEDEDGLPVVTGSRASDRRESNLEYRSAPPMTVSLFGRRWDYSRIEPISTALAALVDATSAYKDAVATTGSRSTASAQALERLMLSAMEQSRDKTFLRGLDDFLSLFEGTSSMVVQDMEGANEKFAKVFRDTYITTLVPNVFRQPARESDDFMREARTIEDDGWPLFLTDGMAPMASDPIAQVMGEDPKVPKRDLWGRPIERKGTIKQSTTALWQLVNTASRMSPVGVIPEKTRREMLPDILMFRWRERVHNQEVIPDRGYLPSAAPRSFRMDNQRYRWTAQEYDRLVEESGQRAYDAVMKLIDSGRVSVEQPTEEHMDLISKAISEQRAAVSSRLKRERKREMRSMEVEANAR